MEISRAPDMKRPSAAVARAGHNGLTREKRFTEEILPHRLETNRTGEFGQRHAFQIQRLAVRKQPADLALIINAKILQDARTIAVLRLQQSRRRSGKLRGALEARRAKVEVNCLPELRPARKVKRGCRSWRSRVETWC